MLENCKRLICSPLLNKVYCIVLYCKFLGGSCVEIVEWKFQPSKERGEREQRCG